MQREKKKLMKLRVVIPLFNFLITSHQAEENIAYFQGKHLYLIIRYNYIRYINAYYISSKCYMISILSKKCYTPIT